VSPLYSQSIFFRSFVSSFGGLPCRCGQDLGTFLKEPCTSEHFCKRDFFLVYSLLCYERDLLFVYSLIYTCTYISLFCNRLFFFVYSLIYMCTCISLFCKRDFYFVCSLMYRALFNRTSLTKIRIFSLLTDTNCIYISLFCKKELFFVYSLIYMCIYISLFCKRDFFFVYSLMYRALFKRTSLPEKTYTLSTL